MRQILFSILTMILTCSGAYTYAQCPEGGITLYDQEDVDNFAIQYPDCTNIKGLLKIGWNLQSDIHDLQPLSNIITAESILITETTLTNLEGLNNLSRVYSAFDINSNPFLISLSGLENLTDIGALTIHDNNTLTSLKGLDNIIAIHSGLTFNYNQSFNDLTALNGLTSLFDEGADGFLTFFSNPSLTTFNGLENLTKINGRIHIHSNPNINSFEAFENLTSLGDDGVLWIQDNPLITSLEGFNNLAQLGTLEILNSPTLTDISALSNLTYLRSRITIAGNPALLSLQGLHNVESLGFVTDPSEGIGSTGLLQIWDNDALLNLEGLNSLQEVWSLIWITGNDNLKSFEGLNNFETLGKDIYITENLKLENLNGLENFNSMGTVDEWEMNSVFWIGKNPSLQNISSLTALTEINGRILFHENDQLTSLSGIENINPKSIAAVQLYSSQNLSTCNLPNICQFLSANGDSEINSNNSGCDSAQEILDLCIMSNDELNDLENIEIYPNPVKQTLNISVKNNSKIQSVQIYDLTGKLVSTSTQNLSKIDFSLFSKGIYLISVKTDKGIFTQKIIKE